MHLLPCQVENQLARDIVEIACGGKHTVAVNSKLNCYVRETNRILLSSENGVSMSFGCGKHGQTGQGTDDDTMEPTRLETLKDKNIVSVACGSIHSCFVTSERFQ